MRSQTRPHGRVHIDTERQGDRQRQIQRQRHRHRRRDRDRDKSETETGTDSERETADPSSFLAVEYQEAGSLAQGGRSPVRVEPSLDEV
eukprot:387724-Rhodomonas_salina.1